MLPPLRPSIAALLLAWSAALFASEARQLEFRPAAGATFDDFIGELRGRTVAAPNLVDAGDRYLVPGGGMVKLLRSRDEVAVQYAAGVAPETGLRSLRALRNVPPQEVVARAELRGRGRVNFIRSTDRARGLDAATLRASRAVNYAYPVLFDPKTKRRMTPTDEVLASFAPEATQAQVQAAAGPALRVIGRAGDRTMGTWRLRLANPKRDEPLAVSRALAGKPGVRWAQPNFLREIRPMFTPPNSLFPAQQSLLNTGQNGGVVGADAKLPTAWDLSKGSNAVVIAIIDDGVDVAHPGLRIATNPGESGEGRETNGIDDDNNGLIDDVRGWDFANGDANASPVGSNGHGTGCAGIAAGIFSAQVATAGVAQGCRILPVKIADDSGVFTTDQAIGEAIVYAAQRADVLSNSWGGGSVSPFINAAIDYAVTSGRGGKGCPSFFATGNSASTWMQGGGRYRLGLTGLSGDYFLSFALVGGALSAGENRARIDNACLLGPDGYSHLAALLPDQDFEFFNADLGRWWLFASTGAGLWSIDTENAFTGTGGITSAQSPLLADGQVSWLFTPRVTLTGSETFTFAASVSLAADAGLYIAVYQPAVDGSLTFAGAFGPVTDTPEPDLDVTYPANYANAIAVGASTDCDLRSDFSQYHGKLDFVAPSNGGWNDIATLDPVGAVGWTDQDYKMMFGGTSAATPLAAGIAALMISRNPTLTTAEIRTLMGQTCDQIGLGPYIEGKAEQYGYGRVNAARAVAAALPVLTVPDLRITEVAPGLTTTASVQLTLGAATVRDVSVNYTTVNESAIAGVNYTAASGTITILAGATTATIPITIDGEALTRPNRAFFVRFTDPVNASLAQEDAVVLITARDSDQDGMADYWETAHGFDPQSAADALLDRDEDGRTNAQEFAASTNPSDGADTLRIASIETVEGGTIRLRFKTSAERVYRVERTSSLSPPTWIPLAEVAGTGLEESVDDADAVTLRAQQYYRVRVLR